MWAARRLSRLRCVDFNTMLGHCNGARRVAQEVDAAARPVEVIWTFV
jgi:hypothetical protein